MINWYTMIDKVVERMLLDMGMSARSTDFVMMGFGGLVLLATALATLGLLALYVRLLLTAYKNMIHNKHARLRRNWSVVFITALILGMGGTIAYFI